MIHGGDTNMQIIISFMVGILIGISFIGLYTGITYDPTHGVVNKAMADCEASLPRNQHCYIIAVPPDKD
jgi:hypothetical protein